MDRLWPENLRNLCRLCLKPIVNFQQNFKRKSRVSITNTGENVGDEILTFSHNLLVPSLGKLFLDLTSLDIAKEMDEFPKSLCSTCVDRLMEYDALRKEAFKSTKRLHRLWNSREANEVTMIKKETGSMQVERENVRSDASADDNELLLPELVNTSIALKSESSDGSLIPFSLNEDIVINGDTIYSCLYSSDDTYDQHSQTTANNSALLNCQMCCKPFSGYTHLEKHIRQVHTGPRNTHQCTECFRSFKDPNQLAFHITFRHKGNYRRDHTATGDPNNLFKCKICNRSYQTEQIFKRHMAHHAVTCPQCSKVFSSRSTLNRHKRIIHDGEKRYGCSYCTLRFGTLSSKISHERQHTGERPFRCEICCETFVQEKSLQVHMRTHKS